MGNQFEAAFALMRKHDPQLQEEGFGRLRDMGAVVLPDLVAAYDAESDHGIKCWLLELIGDAQAESALALLVHELDNGDESLRGWARRGLQRLDTKDARTALWRDEQNRTG